MVADGDLLYVAAGALTVYDLSDPANPTQISSLPVSGARHVCVVDGLAAISCNYGGLVLADLSDPAAPVQLGQAPTSSRTRAAAILGDDVYAANGYGGLQVYDASDPRAPCSLGGLTLPGTVEDLALVDGAVACAAGVLAFAPLQVEDTVPVEPGETETLPELHLLEPPAPNPFNPATTLAFHLDAPQRVRLSVHDLAGRLVRTLVDGPRPAGRGEIRWDGRDDRGRALPSGSYIVRIATESGVESRTATLLE